MAIKSAETIRANLINDITTNLPGVTTRVGSAIRDLFINPQVNQLISLYNEIDRVSKGQSPATASGADLVALAACWGIYQKGSVKALGLVTFYTGTSPASDITIPLGAWIQTGPNAQGTTYRFRTLQAVTMQTLIAPSYFNVTTNRYEVSVYAEAELGGVSYNISVGSVKKVSSAISGIDGATNLTDFSGGADQESLTSLANRVTAKIAGNNYGTYSGYYENVLNFSAVSDVLIVSAGESCNDPKTRGSGRYLCQRAYAESYTDTYTVTSAYPQDFIPTKQPVVTSGVTTIVSSNGIPLTQDTDWEWVKDTGVYRGSVKCLNKIHWLNSITGLGTLTISYIYNGLIEDVQISLTSASYKNLCADILIKWTDPVYVNVSATIRIATGFDASSVVVNVQSAVSQLLSAYALGQEVQKSDIVAIINNTQGVEDVSSALTVLTDRDGIISADTFGNLTIPAYQYGTIGDAPVITVVS